MQLRARRKPSPIYLSLQRWGPDSQLLFLLLILTGPSSSLSLPESLCPVGTPALQWQLKVLAEVGVGESFASLDIILQHHP